MANSRESRLLLERLYSAGISLRAVRSPVAPKITITHGPVWRGAPVGVRSRVGSSRSMLCGMVVFSPIMRLVSSVRFVRQIFVAWRLAAFLRTCVPGGNGSEYKAPRTAPLQGRLLQWRHGWSSGLHPNPARSLCIQRDWDFPPAPWRSDRAARTKPRCHASKLQRYRLY